MDLFLQEDGRYSFSAKKKLPVIKLDKEKEKRKALAELIEPILPELEKVDRLIRNVGVEVTKSKVILFFKIRSHFFQALFDIERLKDVSTIKRLFKRVLKKEIRDFHWTR